MRVNVEKAIDELILGQVIAIPTETVYGLAASLKDEQAVAKIFELKKRPPHNPLIIHIKDKSDCMGYCTDFPDDFDRLAARFWPGPLTMVLPVHTHLVPKIVRANLGTAAFRVPSHPLAQELLAHVGPLVAPSANLSGSPSSTRPEHIESDFGADFPVLDGGCSDCGLESTIIAQKNGRWQIARLGAISASELAEVIGYLPEISPPTQEAPICPGQLLQHYAPKARLILSKLPYESCPNRLACVIGLEGRDYPGAKNVLYLANAENPEQAAFYLYELLRRLDREEIAEAWVDIDLPTDGLWQTILERLSRAASQ